MKIVITYLDRKYQLSKVEKKIFEILVPKMIVYAPFWQREQ